MSMWYFVDGVLILKVSVPPTLTLIEVAKPWMLLSPAPSICQFPGGSPGFEFSHAIGFVTGAAQGFVSVVAAEAVPPPDCATKTMAARRRNGDARAAPKTRRGMGVVITCINEVTTGQTCAARGAARTK